MASKLPTAVTVIGGGLAGPEAAYQLARAGVPVRLYEMRPRVFTPAHQTAALGELVCSNSLKSEAIHSAPWLLKQELRHAGSLLLACAAEAAVPGGQALSVDRTRFSEAIGRRLLEQPGVEIIREEVTALPAHGLTVMAAGPLASPALATALAEITGRQHLYFYDAIAPIVEADSILMENAFAGSRYGKGGDDYLNCPLDRDEYTAFYEALRQAESYPLRSFEEPRFFEACLPLEELARRGPETLRFGPMKPVGLRDPRTGRVPHAVVQLRKEDLRAGAYNLVGFQNHLRVAAQSAVLRLIPALRQARFIRHGQVHRNSYVQAPAVLNEGLSLRARPGVLVAGQLCGTEGYVEAIATGFLAGNFAARRARGEAVSPPPRETALGSLIFYITHASQDRYVPANIGFDLLPPLPPGEDSRDRDTRRARQCGRALAALAAWWEAAGRPGAGHPQ